MIAKAQAQRGIAQKVMWLSLALAVAAGLVYFLMAMGLLRPGDLEPASSGVQAIVYTAAACYVVGGILILLRRRWLWIIGAVVNVLVIAVFVAFYATQPSVLFSAPGLLSKGAQILLEIGLLYLIVTYNKV